MTEPIRLLYAVSHPAAAIIFLETGMWRRLPLCFTYLCVGSILATTYHPESREWIRTVYMGLEPVAVLLRYACAIEALWLQTAALRERLTLAIGVSLVALAVSALVWSIKPGSNVYEFVQFRNYAQIGTAMFGITAAVFLWSQRLWVWDWRGFHAAILLALLVKQAIYAVLWMRGQFPTMPKWQAADWPGLLISSLCCVAWAALALRSGQRRARSGAPADRA